jgi:hypothetical protein
MPAGPNNAIYEIGAFNPRVVRELAALPEPIRQLKAVDAATLKERGDIRIHASAAETARLLQTILARHRFDVSLGDADGHPCIDVRGGDGVLGALVSLLADAIDGGELSFATMCIGKHTLSFYPAPVLAA